MSKLIERAPFNQIHGFLVSNNLYPVAQSAYRRNHSTETALLKVMNDILLNMNKQQVTILVLLDLSAAFDTVDHSILLDRLSSKLGLNGTATSCRPIRSVIILVIKQFRLPLRGRLMLLITRMITDRIGLHSVLLPLLTGVSDSKTAESRTLLHVLYSEKVNLSYYTIAKSPTLVTRSVLNNF